ncbi:G-type lectin S-receptor-like serine/threonine-protein kinase At4g27290 [Phragmites australis]|uniref:G-type lectin S-receptor-like serine/threonine-protein kinase At4g27290 n=1 Tax=Phragmites australis TaxID=29695 RepID=UPI002D78F750|nr:G-type lectin S-receptor-like serine/threonine-protein kinase At4g27290 [Phragmites australis]
MSMARRLPVLMLLLLSPFCQSNDQLTQANTLSSGDMLISQGGDFALGFFSPTNSPKNYIGIWYNKIPELTVVWVANRDNPITTPSAKLVITNSSELLLSDSKGRTLWTTASNITSGGARAVAVLLDSGNFILQSLNGMKIWQSFDHPTDTILPTMRFVLSYKGQVVERLVAWKGLDDPSTGDFSYSLDPSSELQMLLWHNTSPYYRTVVFNDGVSVFGRIYHSNSTSTWIMYQTMVSTEDGLYVFYTVSDGSPYMRFLIDYTGKSRLLSWNNNTLSWRVVKEAPGRCDLYALCGLFGYCDQTEALPTCKCLDGFDPIDSLNFSRGCRRREALKCGKENHFVTLPGMKVPDKFVHIRNRSLDQCAAECSRNCLCSAYAYANFSSAGDIMTDTSRCLVWAGDLVDMWKMPSFGENLYLRLAESPVQNKSNLAKIVLPIIACLLLLASTTLLWICKYRAGKQRKKEVQKRLMLEYLRSTDEDGDKNIEFPFISFEDIVTATDNFSDSNMLGKGGFGKVYKGMLEGTKEVAIKRLSKGSGQGTEEFRNEVVLIAKLQHKNLVKLLGCCIHEDERLLVYEYLPNKSLDNFLFDSARKPMLQWPTRCKIIQGIARGILYLHQDSRLTIIHRDLKASNILLDKEISPKISDFGMARVFCGDQHQANTNRVVGTYGYMSPEYAMEGAFSVKSDTYSFGVLVLEIVSGLKISSPHLIMDFPNLIVYAWNLWKDGKTEDLVDSSVKENCPLEEVSRCIHIGLLCVQDSPNCRPLMSEVVFMLENKTTPLPIPMRPVYFARWDAEPGRAGDNKVRTETQNRSSTWPHDGDRREPGAESLRGDRRQGPVRPSYHDQKKGSASWLSSVLPRAGSLAATPQPQPSASATSPVAPAATTDRGLRNGASLAVASADQRDATGAQALSTSRVLWLSPKRSERVPLPSSRAQSAWVLTAQLSHTASPPS